MSYWSGGGGYGHGPGHRSGYGEDPGPAHGHGHHGYGHGSGGHRQWQGHEPSDGYDFGGGNDIGRPEQYYEYERGPPPAKRPYIAGDDDMTRPRRYAPRYFGHDDRVPERDVGRGYNRNRDTNYPTNYNRHEYFGGSTESFSSRRPTSSSSGSGAQGGQRYSPPRISRAGKRGTSTFTSEAEMLRYERNVIAPKKRRTPNNATAYFLKEEALIFVQRPPFMDTLNNQSFVRDVKIACKDGDYWTNKLVLINAAPMLGILFNDQLPGEVVTIIMPDHDVHDIMYFIDFACMGFINVPKELRLTLVRLMYTFGWTDPNIVMTDLDGNVVPLNSDEPELPEVGLVAPPAPRIGLFNPFATANVPNSGDEGVETSTNMNEEVNAGDPIIQPEPVNEDNDEPFEPVVGSPINDEPFEPVVGSPPGRVVGSPPGVVDYSDKDYADYAPFLHSPEGSYPSDDEVEILPVPIKIPNVIAVIDVDSDENVNENENIEVQEPKSPEPKSPEPIRLSPKKTSPRVAAQNLQVPIRDGWFQMNTVPRKHVPFKRLFVTSPKDVTPGRSPEPRDNDQNKSSDEFPPFRDTKDLTEGRSPEPQDNDQNKSSDEFPPFRDTKNLTEGRSPEPQDNDQSKSSDEFPPFRDSKKID